MPHVNGLHHVTAISSSARGNVDFFTGLLGLRLVKKTVNFDDPETYHLYFGDRTGTPGTVMTFFPWEGVPPGRAGTGEVSASRFAVPEGTLHFWRDRLSGAGIAAGTREAFGRPLLAFADADGLGLEIVEAPDDPRPGFADGPVPADRAIRGFSGVGLTLADGTATAEILTALLGYREEGAEGPVRRFARPDAPAGTVDILTAAGTGPARQGAGRVHHVAFAVPDRAAQDAVRTAVADAGLAVTPSIDRSYFHAIYFRTPDGVLFEVATDEPGFATDEPVERLGEGLMLPPRHAHLRAHLERRLPPLAA